MLTIRERELERQAQVVIQKELTPIQKLREDIKDLDPTLYVRVLALLVEAEGQEKVFLEKVYTDGVGATLGFDDYYKRFGKTK
jgi:hypothetical protein